jgi:hypothetical protein
VRIGHDSFTSFGLASSFDLASHLFSQADVDSKHPDVRNLRFLLIAPEGISILYTARECLNPVTTS